MANKDLSWLLQNFSGGDAQASAELLRVVYEELKSLAASMMRSDRRGHTLQPTALVHEAYLRLLGNTGSEFENRAHFFGAAAQAMRRILVEYSRKHGAKKRGGDRARIELSPDMTVSPDHGHELLALDEAYSKLSALDPLKGKIVELRFYCGLSVEETATVLKLSPRTVKRHWAFAKACLQRDIVASDA